MDMKLAYIMLSTTWVIKSDLNQTCALHWNVMKPNIGCNYCMIMVI